ncbi:hypothetical protein N2152v2_003740 [Parachlorella kessleri]
MTSGYTLTAKALSNDPGVQVVQCERAAIGLELEDADVVVPLMSRLDAALLQCARRCKLVLQFGVGVEGATRLGIWVSNIPSGGTGNAASCAEHAMYLMLATLRHHHDMAASIAQRRLGAPMGVTLLGRSVLVLGFGSIAKELVVRLQAFGVRISVLRRSNTWGSQDDQLTKAAEACVADRGLWPADAARLAAAADLVVVTCHQDSENKGMVGREFLGHCKEGIRIVNVARGGLLDYSAVKEGLLSGKVGGLGLDVHFWEPFDPEDFIAQHPKTYLTPHIAGVTELSYSNMAEVVAREVRLVQQGLPPTRQLNQPPQPRNG